MMEEEEVVLRIKKMEGGIDSSSETFFLNGEVRKGCRTIRIRIDQRLNELGKKWADVYNKLLMNKVDASKIRNGVIIPPKWKRIKIAQALGIDSTCIWDTPILISADKIQKEAGHKNSALKIENETN